MGKEIALKNGKITTRKENYSQWYLDVIREADLAENSPVKGCMVIRPYGYAIWENIQKILDEKFKALGTENAYFPLFIPKGFLEKEAKHVEGFAKECAVVTHHRLELDACNNLQPAGELDEPLIIRPTSETIIYHMFSRWIQSHRDLPLLINQWANVVRWEMKTRPFLRTTEFLWQEGHTAHATKEGAEEKAMQMLTIYQDFVREYLAIEVIAGKKTESEKFAGAEYTTTIEALMQDGKALQSGTSHMLGQNFAKAFDVSFLDKDSNKEYVWQTSWGMSTRIIGALIMSHGDDKGVIMPPMIASAQVIIVPIWVTDEEKNEVLDKAEKISNELRLVGIRVKIDQRDDRPGVKFFEWEKKGVPLRIEIGPRDVKNQSVMTVRRDTGVKEVVLESDITLRINDILKDIQSSLLKKSSDFVKNNTSKVSSLEEFKEIINSKGGFIFAYWCGDSKCEESIKKDTGATSRCIPFDQREDVGDCVFCGKTSKERVLFAKAY
jgi:prolyl-tRNA synthetase